MECYRHITILVEAQLRIKGVPVNIIAKPIYYWLGSAVLVDPKQNPSLKRALEFFGPEIVSAVKRELQEKYHLYKGIESPPVNID